MNLPIPRGKIRIATISNKIISTFISVSAPPKIQKKVCSYTPFIVMEMCRTFEFRTPLPLLEELKGKTPEPDIYIVQWISSVTKSGGTESEKQKKPCKDEGVI